MPRANHKTPWLRKPLIIPGRLTKTLRFLSFAGDSGDAVRRGDARTAAVPPDDDAGADFETDK